MGDKIIKVKDLKDLIPKEQMVGICFEKEVRLPYTMYWKEWCEKLKEDGWNAELVSLTTSACLVLTIKA